MFLSLRLYKLHVLPFFSIGKSSYRVNIFYSNQKKVTEDKFPYMRKSYIFDFRITFPRHTSSEICQHDCYNTYGFLFFVTFASFIFRVWVNLLIKSGEKLKYVSREIRINLWEIINSCYMQFTKTSILIISKINPSIWCHIAWMNKYRCMKINSVHLEFKEKIFVEAIFLHKYFRGDDGKGHVIIKKNRVMVLY